jgi:hypothetical protein
VSFFIGAIGWECDAACEGFLQSEIREEGGSAGEWAADETVVQIICLRRKEIVFVG